MNQGPVFVCAAQMTPEEYKTYREKWAASNLAQSPHSRLTEAEKVKAVVAFDEQVWELTRKHREELIEAGFNQRRGDGIIFSPGVIASEIMLSYMPGMIQPPGAEEGVTPRHE